jgi:hypothetical protein
MAVPGGARWCCGSGQRSIRGYGSPTEGCAVAMWSPKRSLDNQHVHFLYIMLPYRELKLSMSAWE